MTTQKKEGIDFLSEAAETENKNAHKSSPRYMDFAEWGRSVAERAWKEGWNSAHRGITRNPYAPSPKESK